METLQKFLKNVFGDFFAKNRIKNYVWKPWKIFQKIIFGDLGKILKKNPRLKNLQIFLNIHFGDFAKIL